MVYRAAMLVVALFWAGMWWLLIKSELRPQETGLRSVPPELVLKQMFEQGQTSDLVIRSAGAREGRFRLVPTVVAETGAHRLETMGNVQVAAPGAPPNEHASWDVVLEMDREMKVERLRGSITIRPPGLKSVAFSTLQFSMEPRENRGHYALSFSEQPALETDFTLDEAGLNSLLGQWGLDPAMVKSFSPGSLKVAPQITARLTRLITHHEQLETYLVTVRNQGQTLLEMHVSQLGQILQAKTLIGWELATE
jgi:hypothetical protein